MSVTDTYTQRAQQVQGRVADTMTTWLEPVQSLMTSIPANGGGLFDPGHFLEEAFDLTQRLVKVNAKYMEDLTTAVREHMAGLAGVVNTGAIAAARTTSAQVDKVSTAVEDHVHEVERAERAAARRVKKAAHDSAADRYQTMTKAELADQLAERGLAKTGHVDELRERLVENDLGQD